MALTAHPFHAVTHELLPGYRDAYLRGDLSGKNTELVDAYLKANPDKGGEAFQRFHTLKQKGHQVRPVGWVQQQFHLIRTEPVRFRRRAGSLMAVAALVGGAAFAGNNVRSVSDAAVPSVAMTLAVGKEAAVDVHAEALETTARMTTVTGRILDENGRPLVGATVLDKLNHRGVSTNAQGDYTLLVPANQAAKLQVGYGGYSEEDVLVKGRSVQNVTLLPRTDQVTKTKKSHWWQF